MGVGYAAPTPAALKWVGPHQRGLIAGLVVSGYGGAAFYVAPLIKCPTLVVDSDDDQFFPGQARQLFEALRCPKTFMAFTRKDMASMHCQAGALAISNQRILDWLDEHLAPVGREKKPSPLEGGRPSDSGGYGKL